MTTGRINQVAHPTPTPRARAAPVARPGRFDASALVESDFKRLRMLLSISPKFPLLPRSAYRGRDAGGPEAAGYVLC